MKKEESLKHADRDVIRSSQKCIIDIVDIAPFVTLTYWNLKANKQATLVETVIQLTSHSPQFLCDSSDGRCQHEGSRRRTAACIRCAGIDSILSPDTGFQSSCADFHAFLQVTAGLVRQLEGESASEPQARTVRRAGPAWLPHLRPAGYALYCLGLTLCKKLQLESAQALPHASGSLKQQMNPPAQLLRKSLTCNFLALTLLNSWPRTVVWLRLCNMKGNRCNSKPAPGRLEQRVHRNSKSTTMQIN